MTQSKETSRVQSEIDSNLKRAYQDMLQQDVPDRFTNLLAQLRDADRAKTGKGDGGQDDGQK